MKEKYKNIDEIFDKEDIYGIEKKELEIDSDVNEDENRERQLDASFEQFIKIKKESIDKK
jgi:hypothetical protein